MDSSRSKQTDSKKPYVSPYLASLSDVDLRKGVRSNTTFHATSVAAKLPGAGRTVLAFIEEGLKNKDSNSRLVLGKPPKHINSAKSISKRPNSKQSRPDVGPAGVGSATRKPSKQKLFVSNGNGVGDNPSKSAERSKSVSEVRKSTPKSVSRPTSSLVNLNEAKPEQVSTTTEPQASLPSDPVTDEDLVEMARPIKALKSILKIPSMETTGKPPKSSSRPSSTVRTNPMRAVWNKIGGDFTASSRTSSKEKSDNKRVKFFEKVEIHTVPYESRGSTEWQHNLMVSREHILRSLFSVPVPVPMGGYMQNSYQLSNMGGWGSGLGGPMDSWGCLPPTPSRGIRRQRKPF